MCTIVCGAPCEDPKALREHIDGFVIAADRGLDYCLKAGIKPDLVVGDFDSAENAVPAEIECVRVSPIKDDTDAALAADLALERGYRELRFFCALGGRFDHSLANIQLLYKLKNSGIKAELYGDSEKAYFAVNESVNIPNNNGFLSVFSYGESAEISEDGVKYPLDHKVIKNDFALGVSNEITGEIAKITVHSGAALIVETV